MAYNMSLFYTAEKHDCCTPDAGTKKFFNRDVHFGWDTIEEVYRTDLLRAKFGQSRRVPKLKYSYIVRDAWTRLNVKPAKIMQVCI